MRYILNPDIALRSWRLVPYAYYVKGVRNAKGLKKDEFEFLLKCDGKTEVDDTSELAKRLSEKGLIFPAEDGDTLSESTSTSCSNNGVDSINTRFNGSRAPKSIH